MIKRTNRALLGALAITAILTGCEQALLQDPAPATTMLGMQFSLSSSVTQTGPGTAYDKVDQVRVAVFRAADFRSIDENFSDDFTPINALLTTSQSFEPAAENRVQIEVDLENEIEPLVIVGALLDNGSPLFAGMATIQARRGEVNSAPVALVSIPNRLNAALSGTLTAVNDTAFIRAAALFASGDTIDNAPLSFSSSNSAVATVDATGRVIARGADGQTQITVTYADQNFRLTQVVNVTVAIVVTSITVAPPGPLTIDAGSSVQLTATARDRRNNVLTGRTFTWSSSATGIASVDGNGRVTGVAAGPAVITVRTGTASATVNVTVQVHPLVGLSANDIPFSMAIGEADPAAVVINITNAGSGPLNGITIDPVDYLGGASGWLTATLSGSVAPATLSVRPARGTLGAGTFNAAVRVRANADNSPQTITVRFVVNAVQITGRVVNARNLAGIPGALIVATPVSGLVAPTSAIADANGNYAVSVLPNTAYRVTASAQGFISQQSSLTIGTVSQALDFALSPNLPSGQLRVVLTWGQTPADLDAHLFGPLPESTARFEVSWINPGTTDGPPYAQLDVDDRDGLGPETITISQVLTGHYIFAVHNYSQEALLSASGAIVRVYSGSSLVAEFGVPDQSGTVWNVFAIDGGVIRSINTVGGTYAPRIALPDYLAGFRNDLSEAQRLIVEAGQKYKKSNNPR